MPSRPRAKKKLPKRRSPAAAVLPQFKAKIVPDRRRKTAEQRQRSEARKALADKDKD
jgi:hypothetical protein